MFARLATNRRWWLAAAAFLLGAVWLVLMRAVLIVPPSTHYHANFAVFIDGQRQAFDGFGYYQEVTACSQDEAADPRGRVHMHRPDNDVIHVHAEGATWGNFFENLGWTLGDKVLSDGVETYRAADGRTLRFRLNGVDEISVAGRVIQSGDRLLVSYGAEADLAAQYGQIAASAERFNQSYDPGSCSSGESPGLLHRLKHALFQ